MKATKTNAGIALAVLIASVGIPWAWYEMTVWPQRRALPWSASDVHEWSWEDGFLPDYTYYLKARISPDEFRAYVQKLRLTPHTATRKYDQSSSWINWSPWNRFDFDEKWWNPSDSLDDTFVSNHGDWWMYAKFEDGYVYLKSLDH